MPGIEFHLYWSTVVVYALASAAWLAGWALRRKAILSAAFAGAMFGLALHTAAIVLRWVAVGHGPYLGRFEAYSSYAWVAIAGFLVLRWRRPGLWEVGIVALPASFLLMGMGGMASTALQYESPALRSYWLAVHVIFAKVSFASLMLATGVSIVYLRRVRRLSSSSGGEGAGLAGLEGLDDLAHRMTALGFLALAVVIAAGAIWANKAWGRYWNWDPVETWSLATWLLYGTVIHLRTNLRWGGRRAATLTVACMAAAVATFLGLGYASISDHWVYIKP